MRFYSPTACYSSGMGGRKLAAGEMLSCLTLIPTSLIPFQETEHGRLRRQQRGIDKKDLQAAVKYGRSQPSYRLKNGDPAIKYCYKDIVYFVNGRTGEEITSYATPLELESVPLPDDALEEHIQFREENKIHSTRGGETSWTSYTVLVVDASGSMRTSDIWGAPSRLQAVWIALALDYVAHRLESGQACATDVVSVVILAEHPIVLIEEEPCTWILYNVLVEIYQKKMLPPRGHGPFVPALRVTEKLLARNSNAACGVAVLFLSDGKPSDKGPDASDQILQKVESIARQYGRRLTFTAIGIGDDKNDKRAEFSMLKQMVEVAKDYGVKAEFQLPSMTSIALGETFTSVATSLTTTQTEMTDLDTLKQRQVVHVLRESRKKASQAIQQVSPDDFDIYPKSAVKRTIYEEWMEDGRRRKAFKEVPLQHPNAEYVAMSKGPFGEGAERFAYRFFELAADRKTIVGKPLVAKESRLVLEQDTTNEDQRKKFVRTFCFTQQLARCLAEKFNVKLGETLRADPATPRVCFLDCSVYQIDDPRMGRVSVLVEEKLDHIKWHKWNANNGYVDGMSMVPQYSQQQIRELVTGAEHAVLNFIEEGSEDEEDEDSDDDESKHGPSPVAFKRILFTPSQVAQAFSHFTYRATGRKRLVCDLQGVYDEVSNVMKFSDPVIHYYDPGRSHLRCVHGRTDRGLQGFAMFFDTHNDRAEGHCGHLCRLMLRGFRKWHPRPDRAHHR